MKLPTEKDRPDMKSSGKKQIIILGAVVLAGVFLVILGYVPIVWQKYVIRRALQRQSLSVEQVRTSIEQAAILEKQIADLKVRVQRFEQCVPQDAQFSSLWKQIADLITDHDLQNQQVRPGAEIRYDDFNVVTLDIQCSGTLPKIFDFVRSLEQMDRMICIEHMELTNDKNLSGQLTLSAKAEAYYRTPQHYKAG
jgi:Tfp pilus assembly protein PilO